MIAWSCAAFGNWILVIFLGTDAIAYIDGDYYPDMDKRGFLWPSVFT